MAGVPQESRFREPVVRQPRGWFNFGVDELTAHPLARARAARNMTRVDLVRGIRAAALTQGLRSGVDKARIRKWEVDGVTPDRTSQKYIAATLGLPITAVNRYN
ncbi:hypothetical protein ACWGIU_03180 [Streptomyces sp. NPDC054840]